MRRLNATYRKKNKATDILVFPLDHTHGEMVMCKSMMAKKAGAFGLAARDYTRFLFIHGALHLTGHRHGRIMERLEDRWCGVFRIPLPLRNGNTHRRRH
jgi:probable rRNA maturation factor